MTVITARDVLRDVPSIRDIARLIAREQRDQGVIWEADFERDYPLNDGSNGNLLKGLDGARGLLFTRASDATVQVSPSQVVTSGIGVDGVRIGNAGYGKGRVLEESRQNIAPRARPTNTGGWGGITSTITLGYAAGPDDAAATAARIFASSTGAFGCFVNAPVLAQSYVGSVWYRLLDRANRPQVIPSVPATAGTRELVTPGTDAWWRYVSPVRSSASAYCLQVHETGLLAAVDAVCDLAQVEYGSFPTELILTTGAAATRQADSLSISDLSRVVRNGQIRIELDFIPRATRSNYTTFPTLFSYDANNYAVFQASSGRVLTGCGGVTYTSSAGGPFLAFNAGDIVRTFVVIGNCVPEYWVSVNGAQAVNLGGGSLTPAFPSSGPLGIFRTGATQYLSGWLRRMRAYAPGRRPQWAM